MALTSAMILAACGGSTAEEVSNPAPVSSESDPAPTTTVDPGPAQPLPQFTADTVSGGQFEFGSLEGQDAVIWFWAPW